MKRWAITRSALRSSVTMIACVWSSCYTWCCHYSRIKNVSASSFRAHRAQANGNNKDDTLNTHCAHLHLSRCQDKIHQQKIVCETRLIATLFVFSSCLLCHSILFCANTNCTLSLNWLLENNETILRDYKFQLSLLDWFRCSTPHIIHGWGTGYNVSIEIFFFTISASGKM